METAEAAESLIPLKVSVEGHNKKIIWKQCSKEVIGTTETADSSVIPQTTLKRKRTNVERRYTNVDLKKALDAVKTGMPLKRASTLYKIPRTTLLYKKRGTLPPVMKSPGPQCILGEENERKLVEWILHMNRSGFPPTRVQLLDSVQLLIKHLKIKTQFKDNRPGRHWYKAFKNRNREIAEKVTQNLTRNQADLSDKKFREWFCEVQNYFQSKSLLNIDASRVFNCDESAFFLSPKGGSVLTKKSDKTVYSFIKNNEKECLTTLICGSASGELAPPMVLFPYKRIPGYVAARMPRDWAISHSDSGWMTGETFFEYVANVFYPWLLNINVVFPVVLFVDWHTSHLTMALSDFCREKGIELVSLYPNASHILQPIDVAFFHSLKGIWGNIVRNWRIENNDQRLRREDFAPLLQNAIETLDIKSILESGFRTTGLYPFSADRIDYQKNVKDYDSSEKIPPVTETRYKELLEYVENNIETKVLKMFRDVKEGAEWSGDLAHQSLFYLWRKIKDISASEISPAISADSVVQEGHIRDKNGVSIYSEYTTGKVKQEERNDENLNVIKMAEFLPVGDNGLNIRDEISHNPSAVDADCKTIDTTLYAIDAPGTLVSFENANKNSQGTKLIKLENQSTDEGLTELVELRSQCIDEKPKKPTSPKPSTSNSFPKRSFRKINQAKRKVPAILTSDEWIEYAKAKDEKKHTEEKKRRKMKNF